MNRPFEARLSYAEPDDPLPRRWLIQCIEYCTGQRRIKRQYQDVRNGPINANSFWKACLDKLNITLDYNRDAFAAIPANGPLVLISNHPFGVVDGLTMCHFASRLRPNYQMLTNSVLCQDPMLAPHLLPVDFDETRSAMRTNIATKNSALQTLREDGAIVIFPGGGISTSSTWFGPATDLEWKRFTARLVQSAEATVVPIFFHGQNSRLFQIVSQFSLTVRLALLLREANRLRGQTIRINIGAPVPFVDLHYLKNRQALIDALRTQTYALSNETVFSQSI